MDSIVIGGNFLHSYNITTRMDTQSTAPTNDVDRISVELRVRDIEIKTRVPKKFRFPLFQRYLLLLFHIVHLLTLF